MALVEKWAPKYISPWSDSSLLPVGVLDFCLWTQNSLTKRFFLPQTLYLWKKIIYSHILKSWLYIWVLVVAESNGSREKDTTVYQTDKFPWRPADTGKGWFPLLCPCVCNTDMYTWRRGKEERHKYFASWESWHSVCRNTQNMKEEKQPPDFLAEWEAQLHWLNGPICGNHQNWGGRGCLTQAAGWCQDSV